MNSTNQNVFEDIVFTIMDNNGNIAKSEVNKKNTINYLRSKIQEVCGISLQNQCFTCDDERILSLIDGEHDGECKDIADIVTAIDNIALEPVSVEEQDDSAVGLEIVAENEQETSENGIDEDHEDGISITVNSYDGKMFMIKLNGSESIEAVMAKIQVECSVPLNRQYFTCFDIATLSDEFWAKEEEKVCNDIENCREDIANMILFLESDDCDADNLHDIDSGNEKDQETPTLAANNNITIDKESCLTVEFIHAVNDTVCYADGCEIHMDKISQKLWLKEGLHATKDSASSSTAISSLIPAIAYCELETLHLFKQSLSWKEYEFLTASGTIEYLTLYYCTIKYDDNGTTVSADKLFGHLQNIIKFDLHCTTKSSSFQTDTVPNIVKILSGLAKMYYFGLNGLTETFDIPAFTNFVMKNTTIDIRLGFGVKLSVAYEEKLENFIEKIVLHQPKRIPRIKFPGFDVSKYPRYQELYQRQK